MTCDYDDDRVDACARFWAEVLLSNPRADPFWAGFDTSAFYGGAREHIDFAAVDACDPDTRPWRLSAGDFHLKGPKTP